MDVVEPAMVMNSQHMNSQHLNSQHRQSPPPETPLSEIPLPEKPSPATPSQWADASLQQRVEYLGLRLAVALARVLPIPALTAIGAGIAWTVGPWLRQNRRALQNLAIAFPDKSPAEHRRIARAMWANMGRIFAETLVLDRLVADPSCITIADFDHWQARFGTPGPSIGCTLHQGNWELAIWPLKLFGRQPAAVYKPLSNPLVDRWLAGARIHLYPGGLFGKGGNDDDTKSGQRTARQIINVARQGNCVGFVCDHFDRRGTPIPFMGRHAKFTTAPAMIARHLDARLWVGRIVRLGKSSRFRMEIRELEVSKSSDKHADTLAMTTAVFAAFEEWIRKNPEQWMWWNTRWVKPDDVPAAPVANSQI